MLIFILNMIFFGERLLLNLLNFGFVCVVCNFMCWLFEIFVGILVLNMVLLGNCMCCLIFCVVFLNDSLMILFLIVVFVFLVFDDW